ncbi:hypothetical protein RJ639_033342 [Escallonia herrerae]|uniref:Chromo domain-containing protein n=1 Tax=Escallonia herrerae TaxID=1293975 RepID=A0AA89B9G1_9ASTE|nr:hypothetical protein RJ639_033342 [Escallonia herrerae]
MAYKADPPQWWSRQLHPVFHVSMLKPFYEDTADPSRGQIRRQGLKPKAAGKRVVEAILNDRVITVSRKRHQEYLVKWQGHMDEENTWERAADLSADTDKIEAYHMQKLTRASTALVGENVTGCPLRPSRTVPPRPSSTVPPRPSNTRPRKFFKSRARTPNCSAHMKVSGSSHNFQQNNGTNKVVVIVHQGFLDTFTKSFKSNKMSELQTGSTNWIT